MQYQKIVTLNGVPKSVKCGLESRLTDPCSVDEPDPGGEFNLLLVHNEDGPVTLSIMPSKVATLLTLLGLVTYASFEPCRATRGDNMSELLLLYFFFLCFLTPLVVKNEDVEDANVMEEWGVSLCK